MSDSFLPQYGFQQRMAQVLLLWLELSLAESYSLDIALWCKIKSFLLQNYLEINEKFHSGINFQNKFKKQMKYFWDE